MFVASVQVTHQFPSSSFWPLNGRECQILGTKSRDLRPSFNMTVESYSRLRAYSSFSLVTQVYGSHECLFRTRFAPIYCDHLQPHCTKWPSVDLPHPACGSHFEGLQPCGIESWRSALGIFRPGPAGGSIVRFHGNFSLGGRFYPISCPKESVSILWISKLNQCWPWISSSEPLNPISPGK